MIHYQIDSLEAQFQNMKVVLGIQWTLREQPPKKSLGGISKILFLQEDITKNLLIMEKQIIIQRINLILGIIILLKSEKQKLIKLYSLNADLAMQTKKLERVSGSWFSKGKKLDKSDYSDSKKLISTSTFQSAVEAQDKNRSSGPDIINRAGTENAPQGMSIEDVKRLLGN